MRSKRGFSKSKSGQGTFDMSFGMIFSILLIIFFIVIAFIAIKSFLSTKDCAQVGIFSDNLQKDIDKAWNSQKSNFEFKATLPLGLEYICFADLLKPDKGSEIDKKIYTEMSIYEQSNANMFLYPREKTCNMPYYTIKHINLNKTIESRNPYCIAVKDGSIIIQITKDFNEALVKIS
ncbi:MAG: hypothetical protein AABW67_04670 [Nanoarchaeota archaeon]